MTTKEDRRRRRKIFFLLFGWLVAGGGLAIAVTDLVWETPVTSGGGPTTTTTAKGRGPTTTTRPRPTTTTPTTVTDGDFRITGSVAQLFAPGVSRSVDLVIDNPHNFTIRVTGVTITVEAATSRAGCSGTANLKVTKTLSVPVDVPKNATRSLQQLGVAQDAWPVLTMPNLATNQDACKSAVFTLTYSGKAEKP